MDTLVFEYFRYALYTNTKMSGDEMDKSAIYPFPPTLLHLGVLELQYKRVL